METGRTEHFAKKIIAGSRLEITQPGFNNIVMQKIFLAERKKAIKRAFLCWILGLGSLGLVIFLTVLTIYQTNELTTQGISDFFQKTAQLLNENLFIVLPLIVLFIVYRIFNGKSRTRYLPDLNFE